MEADLDKVVTLWYKSWSNAFPELKHPQLFEAWKSRFKNDLVKHSVWVAELQNRIVGFMVIKEIERTLEQIFVDVDVQGIGIGTALLNKAKTICPLGLSLTTLQQNVQARKFYEKHGFVAGKFGVNPVNGQVNIEYTWMPSQEVKSVI
jgi:GNAT superfamily N-acetyltransferase